MLVVADLRWLSCSKIVNGIVPWPVLKSLRGLEFKIEDLTIVAQGIRNLWSVCKTTSLLGKVQSLYLYRFLGVLMKWECAHGRVANLGYFKQS